MPLPPEALVTINGVVLSPEQTEALRCCLSSYLSDLMTQGYGPGGAVDPKWALADPEGEAKLNRWFDRGAEVEKMLKVGGPSMSEHDRVRKERAESCDENDPDSLTEAIRGLQSTDHPSLLPLHDRLLRRLRELRGAG